jgi:Uma2 family endonuclease
MSHAAADLPRRHRLSVADYYRMAEVGILAPDTPVELIDGDIIDMAPPGSLHAATVDRLVDALARVVDDRASVRVQNPVRLSPQQGSYTLVDEPDLSAELDVSALSGVAVDLHRLFG